MNSEEYSEESSSEEPSTEEYSEEPSSERGKTTWWREMPHPIDPQLYNERTDVEAIINDHPRSEHDSEGNRRDDTSPLWSLNDRDLLVPVDGYLIKPQEYINSLASILTAINKYRKKHKLSMLRWGAIYVFMTFYNTTDYFTGTLTVTEYNEVKYKAVYRDGTIYKNATKYVS